MSSKRATTTFSNAEEIGRALEAVGYLPDRGISAAAFVASRLRRPLLVEGEPGVGKTELAKSLAAVFGLDLIRLQCFEGIEASQALYDWDWRRQLLASRGGPTEISDLYGPEFLLERPLLRALRQGDRSLLLIDELDRADDEFDAFLLEMLSDFSVTIPELGTIAAAVPPLVVATSNRTRDLHDALTRRCLYHWIEFPTLEREVDIIRRRAPEVTPRLALSVATTVARIRSLDLDKAPGPAESADWAQALLVMGSDSVADDAYAAEETLGAVVKNYADRRKVREALPHLLHD